MSVWQIATIALSALLVAIIAGLVWMGRGYGKVIEEDERRDDIPTLQPEQVVHLSELDQARVRREVARIESEVEAFYKPATGQK
jgi:hypothetical protein